MGPRKSSKSEKPKTDLSLESQAELVESLARRIRFLNELERQQLNESSTILRRLAALRDELARGEAITDAETDDLAETLVNILGKI